MSNSLVSILINEFFRLRYTKLIVFLLFLQPVRLNGQSFSLRHYSTSEGLNSAIVYSCIQDTKGYMWFGTDAGVCSFDGTRFEQFTKSDGLSDNEVLRLFSDSKERLWFLTFNGHLSFYADGKFFNEENTPWLRKAYVGESYTSAFEDSKGNIYLGSFGSKFILINNESITIHELKNAYGGFNFYESNKSEIYLTSSDQRAQFVNNKVVNSPLQNYNIGIQYIYSKLGNSLYLTSAGLIKVEGNKESIEIPASDLPTLTTITSCIENADSSILISTRGSGALLIPNPHNHSSIKPVKILPDKIVLSIYIDNEKNTWFNTEDDGTYMVSDANKNITGYSASSGLANVNIKRICKDRKGNIWLACDKQVITRISSDTLINYHLSSSQKTRNDKVIDIACENQDELWVATNADIIRINPGKKSTFIPMRYKNLIQHPAFKSLSCDPEGNILVTYFMGIAKLQRFADRSKDYFKSLKGIEFSERTFTHFIDRSKRLWVANINGLNLWNGDSLICFGNLDPLLKGRILQIKEMNNMLVLSTDENGVILFRENKVIGHLTHKNGLPSDICGKTDYNKNRLWVCTNHGLAYFKVIGDSVTIISVYDENVGLLSNDVHDVLDDGEHVYVGTDKGLSILKMSGTVKPSNPPLIYITKLLINNKPVNTDTNLISLKHTENSLIINFVAITFQSPEKLIYQYQLNPANDHWVSTLNNTLEFSSLSPGKYAFSIRAKKVNSEWSEPAKISFTIHPPFWKTAWFGTLAAIIALCILVLLQRYHSRRKLKKQLAEHTRREVLLNERSRISSDMHDDLGAELSRIVVLSEVIRVTEQLDQHTSAKLDKISQYAMDLRVKIDEIIWALNPRHDSLTDLVSYLHRYALDFFDGSNITCHITLPATIPDLRVTAAYRRNVFLIVKEALHNIYKHSSASEVNILVGIKAHLMEIDILDNGNGFIIDANSLRNGLVNMKKRAGETDGELNISSDLGKGCRVHYRGIFQT